MDRRRVVAYDIVSGVGTDALVDAVNQGIEQGFEPFANVFTVGNNLHREMVVRVDDRLPSTRESARRINKLRDKGAN